MERDRALLFIDHYMRSASAPILHEWNPHAVPLDMGTFSAKLYAESKFCVSCSSAILYKGASGILKVFVRVS